MLRSELHTREREKTKERSGVRTYLLPKTAPGGSELEYSFLLDLSD